MKLNKDNWEIKDGIEFNNYLISKINSEKITWTKSIINTNMEVLAIKTPELKSIAKEISKGNYLSFLDLNLNNYYENTIINGCLITKIKDFDLMRKYLNVYFENCDNWATCDLLSFNVKNNEDNYFKLSKEYLKSPKPFVRRGALSILFKLIKYDEYIDSILNIINSLYDEKEYYVNMINAWLLCECFIKRREKTLDLIKNNHINKFTINKAISKCHDSYRVSLGDKEMLKKYRK